MRNLTLTVTGTQQKKVYIRVLANDVPITRGKLISRPGESEIKFRANTCAYHRRRISSVLLACAASVSSRVIARKLERKQKKKRLSPPPPPSFNFFLLWSRLSRRTSRGNACYAGYGFTGRMR